MMQQCQRTITERQARVISRALVALRLAEDALIEALGDKDPAANFTEAEAAWVAAFREQSK